MYELIIAISINIKTLSDDSSTKFTSVQVTDNIITLIGFNGLNNYCSWACVKSHLELAQLRS